MEEQLGYERQPDPLLDAWDALPRGPAIFVATCDGQRLIHGCWVSVDQPEPYFFAELDLLLGETDEAQRRREWLVLDQIDIGEQMLPERLSLSGLQTVLAARRGGST
jgi:hypothetical protein